MNNKSFFKKIHYLESVDSTNSYLKNSDFEDKTLIYTYNQLKGRGRGENTWINFSGMNLALSFLLKPEKLNFDSVWYIAVCSLALIDLVEEYDIAGSWIKWPNDIFINDCKLAGVLAESVWAADKIDKIVIGIGININSGVNEFNLLDNNATSIAHQAGGPIEIDMFTRGYQDRLSYWLDILINEEDVSVIKQEWLAKSKIVDRNVQWILADKCEYGKIVGIDDGGLLLFNNGRKVVKISAGDIKLV